MRRMDWIPALLLSVVALWAMAGSAAAQTVTMPFADERSVVQTRFATSALTLLRAHLGVDVDRLVADVRRALDVPVDDLVTAEQVTFLGRGWTVGLTYEAALKTREVSARSTSERPRAESSGTIDEVVTAAQASCVER